MKEKETKGRKTLIAIVIAIASTTLAGCGPMPQEHRDKIMRDREQAYKAQKTATAEHLFFKAEFEGHSYIVYEHFVAKAGGPSILHDPDCHCQKKGGAL